jgi:anaerobic ribonucleoside-triphosphate reductase
MSKINIIKKIPCEIFTRSVGYFRPVSNWNKGKKAEFRDRFTHDPKKIINKLKKM